MALFCGVEISEIIYASPRVEVAVFAADSCRSPFFRRNIIPESGFLPYRRAKLESAPKLIFRLSWDWRDA